MLKIASRMKTAVPIFCRQFATTSAYLSTDRHKPDLQKELTFNKMQLLHEITNVLSNDLKITTPSPI